MNNFDNIVQASLTLFQMMTGEGQNAVTYFGLDATGVDMQPKKNSQMVWIIFFFGFIVIGRIFLMNLFVGIVIENFNRMKDTLSGFFMMTKD